MSIIAMLAQSADITMHGLAYGGLHAEAAARLAGSVAHLSDAGIIAQASDGAQHYTMVAQAGATDATNYAAQVKTVGQDEQIGWLGLIGKHFIGVFQKGGETFAGFVTGIIPTLVVLMTAFYAVTEIVGEHRVHGIAQAAGRIALTRYTLLPLIAVFFLTNPMAYTFGTFLEEKHKPAFYDSAVSFVHPILGLFPHANAGEYFVWGGVLVALTSLEKAGTVPANYHVTVAIWYFIVGLVVCLLKGILTERITAFLARRQGVEL
ncbi:PTS glucitol/sorbitol transporter subunit IIC [Segnochrobactrum spirostomi]|nr:PTS glucitol/sorbitol transporter subunit IIC [Segnochrobactrum spirostomi]